MTSTSPTEHDQSPRFRPRCTTKSRCTAELNKFGCESRYGFTIPWHTNLLQLWKKCFKSMLVLNIFPPKSLFVLAWLEGASSVTGCLPRGHILGMPPSSCTSKVLKSCRKWTIFLYITFLQSSCFWCALLQDEYIHLCAGSWAIREIEQLWEKHISKAPNESLDKSENFHDLTDDGSVGKTIHGSNGQK